MDLSIIIPVYNTWHSVKVLVNQIQSYASVCTASIELILVDDASTERLDLDAIGLSTLGLKIVFLEKNVGAGGARDIGLEAASGRYVWFVDSDDELQEGWHLVVDRNLTASRPLAPDFFLSNATVIDLSGNASEPPGFRSLIPGEHYSVNQLFASSEASPSSFNATVWRFWIRRDLLISNQIRFGSLRLFEDVAFLAEVFSCAGSCSITGDLIYKHKRRANSLSSELSWYFADRHRYLADALVSTRRVLISYATVGLRDIGLSDLLISKANSNLCNLSAVVAVKGIDTISSSMWSSFYDEIRSVLPIIRRKPSGLGSRLSPQLGEWINSLFDLGLIESTTFKSASNFVVHCYSAFSLAWAIRLQNFANCPQLCFIDSSNHGFKDPVSELQVLAGIESLTSAKPDFIVIANRRKTVCEKIRDDYLASGVDRQKIIMLHSPIELEAADAALP